MSRIGVAVAILVLMSQCVAYEPACRPHPFTPKQHWCDPHYHPGPVR